MKKQDIISKIYKLRNEAYNKIQELEHPDFMYWDNDKIKYEERFKCYDKCLELLMKLN